MSALAQLSFTEQYLMHYLPTPPVITMSHTQKAIAWYRTVLPRLHMLLSHSSLAIWLLAEVISSSLLFVLVWKFTSCTQVRHICTLPQQILSIASILVTGYRYWNHQTLCFCLLRICYTLAIPLILLLWNLVSSVSILVLLSVDNYWQTTITETRILRTHTRCVVDILLL